MPARIERGNYARSARPRVVHLGVGAFHRAHQADYFDRLNSRIDDPWLIIGASLRSSRAVEQLNPQEGLFLHIAQGAGGDCYRVNSAITSVINAFEAPELLADAIASPDVQLVTLTITEKGYCLDSQQNNLNISDPDVSADCDSLDQPKTAIGHLVAGLAKRQRNGSGAITVLSCDNLSHNGDCTRRAVLAMANAHSVTLHHWVETQVSFPNAMVDRIAPALSEEDYLNARKLLQLDDQGLAVTEQFSQWVIEDNFAGKRPPLEKVGVIWVTAVDSWEKRKLRLLNAAHSTLAYVASEMGEVFVHSAIAKQSFQDLLQALWSEMTPTMDSTEDFDQASYCSALIDRFSNPHLNHQLKQIAMDGSQKLPPRLLAPIRDRLKLGLRSPVMTRVVAAWCVWVWRHTQATNTLLEDPMADVFAHAIAKNSEKMQLADTLAGVYDPLKDLMDDYPTWADDLRSALSTEA